MARRPEFYFDEKTGYYRKRVKLQSGAYKDVRAKSKEELRAKLYDLETAQRMGVILDDKTTVAQLLAQWYTNRKDGLSYSRRRDYVNAINNHICPIIGGYRLRSVKPEDCQRVMAALASKSNSLQTKVLGVMNMGFDCAVENGLIFRSPCAKIKAGGVPTEEKVPLTPEQCAALEDATKGTRAYLFVLIGLYTGLRREEICGLRWSDLDLNAAAPHLTVNNAVRFDGGRVSSPPRSKRKRLTVPFLCPASWRTLFALQSPRVIASSSFPQKMVQMLVSRLYVISWQLSGGAQSKLQRPPLRKRLKSAAHKSSRRWTSR